MNAQKARRLYQVAEVERMERFRMGKPKPPGWVTRALVVSVWLLIALVAATVVVGSFVLTLWLVRYLLEPR